jgi:DNA-binding transcriptional ArsR family regulator
MARAACCRLEEFLQAMADDTRQHILTLLSEREMTVSEVCRGFSLSQPTISHHLGVLRRANLVRARREGRQVFYCINTACVVKCCGQIQALFNKEASG